MNLSNDKRRLEADVSNYQRDREEAVTARRAAEERADKLNSELSRVSEQLRTEQETNTRLETSRKQLEVSVRELTIRIEHVESSKDGKKSIANLQTHVC